MPKPTLQPVDQTTVTDTPQVESTTTAMQPPEIAPLRRGDCRLAEFSNNDWVCTAPAGIDARQLDLHPTFWAAADECRMGDEITVLAADRAWVAVFVVVHAERGRVAARLAYVVPGLGNLMQTAGPKSLPAGYRIDQLPPNDSRGEGYVVVREADDVVITNSGKPWPSYQAAYESFLQHAIFQSERGPRYFP
jgi:hypothetical protein